MPSPAAIRLTTDLGLCLSGLATIVFLMFGRDLVAVVTTAEDVRAATVAFIPWAAFTAMSGVLAFQMDGVFIGATWSRDMRNMMLLSFAAYLAALYLLAPPSAIMGCGHRCTSSCWRAA